MKNSLTFTDTVVAFIAFAALATVLVLLADGVQHAAYNNCLYVI